MHIETSQLILSTNMWIGILTNGNVLLNGFKLIKLTLYPISEQISPLCPSERFRKVQKESSINKINK